MSGSLLPFPKRSGQPGSRPVTAAPRLSFDLEHCDGCLSIVSRSSLANRQVDAAAPGVDGWKALCRRCVRLIGEGRPFGSLRPTEDPS